MMFLAQGIDGIYVNLKQINNVFTINTDLKLPVGITNRIDLFCKMYSYNRTIL